jgi:thiol-disulfide isomerase/thioredoxin
MTRSSSGNHIALAAAFATSLLGLVLASGCNSVTGAEGLQIGGSGTGGAGGSETTTTTPTPTVQCDYPTTGFSTKPGGVLPNRKWQGFVNENMDAAAPTDVTMADYHDCDGSKGTNALLIDVSATWCGSCQEEAKLLTNKMKTQWDALGIRVVTLMIEDAANNPATLDTALEWKTHYKLTSTTVAADPDFFFSQLASGGSVGLPFLIVVDPRTMTLVETQQGYPFDESKIVALAKQNQPAQ